MGKKTAKIQIKTQMSLLLYFHCELFEAVARRQRAQRPGCQDWNPDSQMQFIEKTEKSRKIRFILGRGNLRLGK